MPRPLDERLAEVAAGQGGVVRRGAEALGLSADAVLPPRAQREAHSRAPACLRRRARCVGAAGPGVGGGARDPRRAESPVCRRRMGLPIWNGRPEVTCRRGRRAPQGVIATAPGPALADVALDAESRLPVSAGRDDGRRVELYDVHELTRPRAVRAIRRLTLAPAMTRAHTVATPAHPPCALNLAITLTPAHAQPAGGSAISGSSATRAMLTFAQPLDVGPRRFIEADVWLPAVASSSSSTALARHRRRPRAGRRPRPSLPRRRHRGPAGAALRQRALEAQHAAEDRQRRGVRRVHAVVATARGRRACAPACTACPRRSG